MKNSGCWLKWKGHSVYTKVKEEEIQVKNDLQKEL